MRIETHTVAITNRRSSERGAALIMALMVSLILVFLGMGLLLQTSLGLQAAGTDRWVTKALYAADAGAMMQIEMIQLGALGADPNLTAAQIAAGIHGAFDLVVSNPPFWPQGKGKPPPLLGSVGGAVVKPSSPLHGVDGVPASGRRPRVKRRTRPPPRSAPQSRRAAARGSPAGAW